MVSAPQFSAPSPGSLDDCDRDSEPYLRELGVPIVDARQRIQFHVNRRAPVHRWSPYVQGFSAEFVGAVLDRHWADYAFDRRDALVYDPFTGSDPCPPGYDYYQDQYDLDYRASQASR